MRAYPSRTMQSFGDLPAKYQLIHISKRERLKQIITNRCLLRLHTPFSTARTAAGLTILRLSNLLAAVPPVTKLIQRAAERAPCQRRWRCWNIIQQHPIPLTQPREREKEEMELLLLGFLPWACARPPQASSVPAAVIKTSLGSVNLVIAVGFVVLLKFTLDEEMLLLLLLSSSTATPHTLEAGSACVRVRAEQTVSVWSY